MNIRAITCLLDPGHPIIEDRLAAIKERKGIVDEDARLGVLDQLLTDVLDAYSKNPDVAHLAK